jgi:hypothetical protein
MTNLTPIVNSVHTYNDSLQRRRVPLSVFTSTESDRSELDDITHMTPIVNSVHMYIDSLHRRR